MRWRFCLQSNVFLRDFGSNVIQSRFRLQCNPIIKRPTIHGEIAAFAKPIIRDKIFHPAANHVHFIAAIKSLVTFGVVNIVVDFNLTQNAFGAVVRGFELRIVILNPCKPPRSTKIERWLRLSSRNPPTIRTPVCRTRCSRFGFFRRCLCNSQCF